MQLLSKGTEKEERHGTGSDLCARFKTRNYSWRFKQMDIDNWIEAKKTSNQDNSEKG